MIELKAAIAEIRQVQRFFKSLSKLDSILEIAENLDKTGEAIQEKVRQRSSKLEEIEQEIIDADSKLQQKKDKHVEGLRKMNEETNVERLEETKVYNREIKAKGDTLSLLGEQCAQKKLEVNGLQVEHKKLEQSIGKMKKAYAESNSLISSI